MKPLLFSSLITIATLLSINTAYSFGNPNRDNLIRCVKKETRSYLEEKNYIIKNTYNHELHNQIIDGCNLEFVKVIKTVRPLYAYRTYIIYHAESIINSHNDYIEFNNSRKDLQDKDNQKRIEELKKIEKKLKARKQLKDLPPLLKLEYLFDADKILME